MKATGIVRRIDELGRVVIPKEIRRTFKIRVGDPLEIYTERNGEVIFRKYSLIGEISTFAQEYLDSLFKISGFASCIIDRDNVIAVAGISPKEILNKKISEMLETCLNEADTSDPKIIQKKIQVIENWEKYVANLIVPIIYDANVVGAVLLFENGKKITNTEIKLVETAANFLAKTVA